ncbi:SpoIIE family protein phosphatase [Actinokineospora guangxiensis]|uniref:histidine kinase n=1 Tax=Actinokineospora guangxiensis TaxID=1490288 RepID=A0ABW0EJ94_9PSEU
MAADRAGPAELVFPGGSEMAARMRAHPWAETTLGPPQDWPAGLRAAVRICLTSRFPMIVWWDSDLRFLYNDAYMPLMGAKHPALFEVGERIWAEIWHIVGPMLTSVLETGEATWSEDQLLPLDRHGYLEETYWTYSYSPLHDDEGAVRGVFTAVRDTTDRVIGERRLAVLRELGALAGRARDVREAGELVARALDAARADLPYVEVHLREADSDGLVLAATTPAGETGRGWPLEEALAGEAPVVIDDVVARVGALPSGGWQVPPAQAAVFPIPGDTAGKQVGAVVFAVSAGRPLDEEYLAFLGLVVHQVAALVNAAVSFRAEQRRNEQLTELDRAKTAFFSNVSHEFRTPLTLMLGPVDELRAERQRLGEPPSEELEVLHRNALRLGKLVNTLLDFSRIEAGRVVAQFEPVDLAAFTTELAGVFRSAFDKAGVAFEVDCPPLPHPVHVDRGMWEKVVLNLLSNALKHTFEGTVSVRLRAEGGQAELLVGDTGIGIAAEEMPRLFERFHRIQAARARSNEGSGIGLALVRELIDLHGGTITARSAPGEGTEFAVRVPFGVRHLDPERVSPHPQPGAGIAGADPFIQEALRWLPDGEDTATGPWGSAESASVLVADDNADMRDYLVRLLSPAYRVTAVEDGLAALAAARATPPDLLISDVMMPGMDGLALVGALREDQRTARTPIVLLSARAGQEAAIDGLEAGADDYLVKPFTAAELLARVRSAIALSGLRERHERWRDTLIDSLREAFFVADEEGAVIEINTAFTDLIGYGPDGLPYSWRHPWLPDERVDPEAHRLADAAFAEVMGGGSGTYRIPVVHREGQRLWIEVTLNPVEDPGTHRKVLVGTFRDITAEHYAVQTDAAVAAMSVRLGSADTMDDALRGALGELRGLWRSAEVVAAVWTDADDPTVLSTEPHRRWAELRPEQRHAAAALRTSPPLVPAAFPGVGAGIALKHPDGLLAILIDLHERRPLSTEDRTLLALLGGHLGQGLHRAHQIDQQRTTALELQRAMLGPAHQLSGLVVRYEPAARPLEVGGDWYDTVELADGRIGIVVGDCVGRGLPAAAVMGQLRSACRALLLQDSSPAQTLMALDRFAAVLPGAMCTTVFCGVLDLAERTLVYSSAGHPPGILTHRDGSVDQLDGGRATPLAVRPGHPRPEATCAIPPRSTLLLYTDGLIERRRAPLTDGIDRAIAALHAGRGTPIGDLADDVMTALAPDVGYDDDVALLLYRDPAPLSLGFPAVPERLAPARAALREWLARCDIDADLAQNVLVAVGEACTNAIEHGYLLAPDNQVTLHAEATVTGLRLLVRDSGAWKPRDATPHRGRGIDLMRAVMDDVVISPSPHGTTVEMRVRTD